MCRKAIYISPYFFVDLLATISKTSLHKTHSKKKAHLCSIKSPTDAKEINQAAFPWQL